tara:strand:- start:2247 stop:3089 length:843 start_codon:yes stop_codon:yes gene_type:complete
MKFILSFLFILFFSFNLFAKNVVYVVVEGVSRATFYELLNRNKLPNYRLLIERGNYRNLGIDEGMLVSHDSTLMAYSGYSSKQFHDSSFIEQLKLLKPQLDIKCFLSVPIDKKYPLDIQASLVHLTEVTDSPAISYRTSTEIGVLASDYVKNQKDPFFLVLNFTNVDYVGWRYREGAMKYSMAIKNTDKSLGLIIDALKQRQEFENTEFLITTNYGYHRKLQIPNEEAWVVSTQPVLRKGSIHDIFPSLMDLLDVSSDMKSYFKGNSLFRYLKQSMGSTL